MAKDKDPNSKFYFTIDKYESQDGKELYTIIQSPKDEKEVKGSSKRIGAEYLTEVFDSWVKLLENYNTVKSFFDDPILESYQAEFTSNFEFLDESVEKNPFNTTQILQLDYLLEQISTRLIDLSNDRNRSEIEAIAAGIVDIRNDLPSRSQKWFVDKIANIYAKIAKQGVVFIKEFWAEGKKEFIKNIVKGLIEAEPDIFNP